MVLSIYLHQKPYYKQALPRLFLYLVLTLASPRLVLAQHNHENHSFETASNPLIMGFVLAIATSIVVVIIIVLILCWQSRRWRRVRAHGAGLGYRVSVGLDPSIVESFPVFKYSEVSTHLARSGPLECAVCLSPFQPDEKLRLLPKCNHVFHVECLDPWLKGHSTCPLCRIHLTPEIIELDQMVESGALNRLEGEVSESEGALDGNEVVEVRVDIEEGHMSKYKRWKSTGYVAESARGEEECWKKYTLLLSEEERMRRFGEVTNKFKRTRSSI